MTAATGCENNRKVAGKDVWNITVVVSLSVGSKMETRSGFIELVATEQ